MAKPPLTLPISPYAPDLPDYPAQGSANVRNVVPRTPGSYGPLNSPSVISNALGNRCQGAAAFFDINGQVNILAGDSTKLYRLTSGDAYSWQDVTNVTGGYNIGADQHWEFEYFNGSALATDFSDNVQTFNLASDANFSDLSPDAPKAKHLAVIKNSFVVLGNTNDSINGNKPQRVWWSAAGDATNWPTPGSVTAAQVQSGAADLFGDDGAIQAIRGGLTAADGLVFQQYGIRRMVYAGPPEIFAFLPAQNVRGTPAPNSPVVAGGTCYFLGFDGFYSTDGGTTQPIGANKVDKTFFNDLDVSHVDRMFGVADPINKAIIWAYPGQGNDDGTPNRLIIYHWQLDQWTIADVTCEMLARLLGIGYTLDELFTVLGYTLDDLPAPLDSAIWQGGSLVLGLFDGNHKLNYLTGTPLAATIDTSEMQPVPGRRLMITGARPLVDGATPSVAINHRERLQDSLTLGPAIVLNALGICPQRASGRYIRASITIPADDTWTNCSGVELDAVPQGTR